MRALFIGLLLLSGTAAAQEPIRLETKVTPMSSGGQHTGCSLEYTMMIRDRIYRSGGFVGLTGTYAWLADREGTGFLGLFKMGTVDFDDSMKGTLFRPYATTLKIGRKVHRPGQHIPCDKPTNVCGAYSMEASTEVFKAMLNEPIHMGYNRRQGSFDVMIPLGLTMQDKESLVACMSEFATSLKQY